MFTDAKSKRMKQVLQNENIKLFENEVGNSLTIEVVINDGETP